MKDCIFCKIVSGDIPCFKIWEDDNYLAFLDINPNTKGMTLVIPKDHHNSDLFTMEDKQYGDLLLASKKVSQLLKKALDVKRVAMVMEGMGVNHTHIKLYPLYGLEDHFTEMWAEGTVYFDNYEGYISTQLGPKADINELAQLAERIVSVGSN